MSTSNAAAVFIFICLYFSNYIHGFPRSFEDRIIALDYDKRFYLMRFYDHLIENSNKRLNSTEKIRQCTCEEYDVCVDIASDKTAIYECHSLCSNELIASGIKVKKYIDALDKNNDCSYLIQYTYERNKNFCATNDNTFIPKSIYSSNYQVSLSMHLLRNNLTIFDEGINEELQPITKEELHLHDCTAKCLWKKIKACFIIKACDIGLPKGYYLGQPTDITSYQLSGNKRTTDGWAPFNNYLIRQNLSLLNKKNDK